MSGSAWTAAVWRKPFVKDNQAIANVKPFSREGHSAVAEQVLVIFWRGGGGARGGVADPHTIAIVCGGSRGRGCALGACARMRWLTMGRPRLYRAGLAARSRRPGSAAALGIGLRRRNGDCTHRREALIAWHWRRFCGGLAGRFVAWIARDSELRVWAVGDRALRFALALWLALGMRSRSWLCHTAAETICGAPSSVGSPCQMPYALGEGWQRAYGYGRCAARGRRGE